MSRSSGVSPRSSSLWSSDRLIRGADSFFLWAGPPCRGREVGGTTGNIKKIWVVVGFFKSSLLFQSLWNRLLNFLTHLVCLRPPQSSFYSLMPGPSTGGPTRRHSQILTGLHNKPAEYPDSGVMHSLQHLMDQKQNHSSNAVKTS